VNEKRERGRIAYPKNDVIARFDRLPLSSLHQPIDDPTVWRSVGCSIKRFGDNSFRSISVRIAIRCIAFINGRPISGCSV